MPPFERYPGESIANARRRIAGNRRNQIRNRAVPPNPRPGSIPRNRMSPLNAIRNNQRPGPGIAPPNVPGIMGDSPTEGPPGAAPPPKPRPFTPPGPNVGGPRRPGSGGSRTMRRPTLGNIIKPNRRRGY